jgi:hypothetical protein
MIKVTELYLITIIFMLTLVVFFLIKLMSSSESFGIILLNILSAIQTAAILLLALILLRGKKGE